MSEHTIIHHITHSNGICSETVNITGIAEEERSLYKDTITLLQRAERQTDEALRQAVG